MHIERSNWNRRQPNDSTPNGAVIAVGIVGFIMAISVYGLALWLGVWILGEQGAIDWSLEVWQAYLLAAVYLVCRSMGRVMYSKG